MPFALRVGDDQYQAIAAYEEHHRLDVHYLLYNPWSIDTSYSFPRHGKLALGPPANGGCQVVAGAALRAAMASKPAGYSPTFAELSQTSNLPLPGSGGWRLENFISNLLLKCKQGNLFESLDQENIFALFNRRSGPIAAAVAVTIEQFAG